MCYTMSDLIGDNYTNGVSDQKSDMVKACYSCSWASTAFAAALLRLLLFALWCHLLVWWRRTILGWFYEVKGAGFDKGVVLLLKRVKKLLFLAKESICP